MILHIINKPPSASALCIELTHSLAESDAVLLIEDGTYHASDRIHLDQWIHKADKIFSLEPDSLARGINSAKSSISFVSYESFVKLTTEYEKTISWY